MTYRLPDPAPLDPEPLEEPAPIELEPEPLGLELPELLGLELEPGLDDMLPLLAGPLLELEPALPVLPLFLIAASYSERLSRPSPSVSAALKSRPDTPDASLLSM